MSDSAFVTVVSKGYGHYDVRTNMTEAETVLLLQWAINHVAGNAMLPEIGSGSERRL